MEETIQELFGEMVERFRKEKHEFDDESLEILYRVFSEAFQKGLDAGRIQS